MTEAEYKAYEESVRDFYDAEGISYLSAGYYKCPDCDVEFECSQCPECLKDSGPFSVEPFVSSSPCDCCGDSLQGDRYDAHAFSEKTQKFEEYVICPDCVYYAEHGRLDDTTMDNIKPDIFEFDEEFE